ncbi:DUF6597 domain-containing transcriptional factor [Dactylosporangium sp. NPDC000555]|uniref:DUF6597 domain-containing transcriptional factor n=1 Tax=Dactylosporangium sp. NPDC000555 TaxID=3154260 RepID=UPI00331D7451
MIGRMRDSRELAGAWSRFQGHGFAPAADDLARLVARYWWARWDLRGEPDYRQLIVPQPSVQLTFPADGPPMVRGVSRGRIQRTLSGLGAVFGVTFRPAVFRRFLDTPVDALTDRALPAAAVFGPDLPSLKPGPLIRTAGAEASTRTAGAQAVTRTAEVEALTRTAGAQAVMRTADVEASIGTAGAQAVMRTADVEALTRTAGAQAVMWTARAKAPAAGNGDTAAWAVAVLAAEFERFLRARMPPGDPVGDEVAGWVADIAATPALRRVDQLAERYGTGARRLQRLFAEHVGVSPKWVIRRFRLHEITERMGLARPARRSTGPGWPPTSGTPTRPTSSATSRTCSASRRPAMRPATDVAGGEDPATGERITNVSGDPPGRLRHLLLARTGRGAGARTRNAEQRVTVNWALGIARSRVRAAQDVPAICVARPSCSP